MAATHTIGHLTDLRKENLLQDLAAPYIIGQLIDLRKESNCDTLSQIVKRHGRV